MILQFSIYICVRQTVMKKITFSTAFLLLLTFSNAQGIAGYVDYKNYFLVFDNGITKEMEYLPVKWYKVGKNSVIYVDNMDNTQGYYNGNKYLLADLPATNAIAADDFSVFYANRILKAFDHGRSVLLAGWTEDYVVGDSIVGALDQNGYSYKIYYNRHKMELPDGLNDECVKTFIAGDNLLAYKSVDGYYKVFYKDEVFNTGATVVSKYKAAANVMAFVNDATGEFKTFYKGNFITLEPITPQSFSVGDNMVAYLDNSGSLKVFYEGNTYQLTSFTPQFYSVTDNILAYSDNQAFTIFYKGKTYLQETNFLPEEYVMDYSTLVYLDRQGYLQVFSDGKTLPLVNERNIKYDLFGNTVRYVNSMKDTHFFLNGKTY